jgi:hypothetical protein
MVVLEHPIVAVIYYVKVARRVNRDSAWRGQAAGADTGAFRRRETAAGAKDLLCRRAGGERSVVFEHPAVGAVFNIDVARVVCGDGSWTAQAVGAAPAEIAFLGREAPPWPKTVSAVTSPAPLSPLLALSGVLYSSTRWVLISATYRLPNPSTATPAG